MKCSAFQTEDAPEQSPGYPARGSLSWGVGFSRIRRYIASHGRSFRMTDGRAPADSVPARQIFRSRVRKTLFDRLRWRTQFIFNSLVPMIAYLEGRLAETWDEACLLVTESGVGYEVGLPTHTCAALPERGKHAAFYICHVIREDAQELYGFATFEERQTFRTLLSISKVGARTALSILSLYRPDELRRVAADEDITALTRVPGIGKKTAQHILLELKYKLKAEGLPASSAAATRPSAVFRDAVDGLLNLGYPEEECAALVRELLQESPDLDVSEVLRAALKTLGKGRM